MTNNTPISCQLRVRFMRDNEIALGPGKIDLLEAVSHHGSIRKAAASMGMSYRRAWLLVNTMNQCFQKPLVDTRRGGDEKGGACLSQLGETVLMKYRALESAMEEAGRDEIKAIVELVNKADAD